MYFEYQHFGCMNVLLDVHASDPACMGYISGEIAMCTDTHTNVCLFL